MPAAMCSASASRSPSATSAATGSGSAPFLRRIGEVGECRRKLLGRAEGAGEPHAPAARQAERGQHRLEDRLVAERDGQCAGRAARASAAHGRRPASGRRRGRYPCRRDPRCRPGRTRCRPRGAGGTPRRDRNSGAACRPALAMWSRQTGMVNSGRRQSVSPVSLSVRKMRRRRSSPAMSRNGSAGWMTGTSTGRGAARGEEREDVGRDGGVAGGHGAGASRGNASALRCPPLACRPSPPQGGRLAAVDAFAQSSATSQVTSSSGR